MVNSSTLIENYEMRWWKHSSYELVNGRITPRNGATLRFYDPWQDGDEGKASALLQQALNELISLVTVGATEDAKVEIDDVLTWSRNYGPLGVLPHCILAARLEPQPLTDRVLDQLDENARGEGIDTAGKRDLVRSRLSGTIVSTVQFHGGWRRTDHLPLRGDKKQWPGIAVLRDRTPSIDPVVIAPMAEAWGRFFPSAAGRSQIRCPLPETTEFVQSYSEPLDEWLHWAALLTKAFIDLSDEDDQIACNTGAANLSWLADPIRPILRRVEKRRVLTWRSPSLLGALAIMLMHQTAASVTPRICKDPKCSRRFLPSDSRAEYHDKRCRFRHSKELNRELAKHKRKKTGKRKVRS
jgi:hypothetical protein